MKVALLVQQSYRDAQLVAEEGETATATQIQTGTNLLNRILRRISTDGFQIPLISEETFFLTAGVTTLELAGWSKLEKVLYYLGDVLVDVELAELNTYYDNAVLRNSPGTPYIAYPKRTPTGITLSLFLEPNENYEILIKGYKNIPTVLVSSTIELDSIAGFMEDYLGYLLSIDLQINAQLSTISPWLKLKAMEYEQHFNRLKFQRTDPRVDRMGDEDDGGGKSIIGYGVSGGWSY